MVVTRAGHSPDRDRCTLDRGSVSESLSDKGAISMSLKVLERSGVLGGALCTGSGDSSITGVLGVILLGESDFLLALGVDVLGAATGD